VVALLLREYIPQAHWTELKPDRVLVPELRLSERLLNAILDYLIRAESCLGFTVPRLCSSSDGFSTEWICCNNSAAVHRDRRCDAPPRPSAVVARPSADVRPAAAASVWNTVQAARLPAGPTSRRAPAVCPPYKHLPACACVGRSSHRAMLPQLFPRNTGLRLMAIHRPRAATPH